jgi:hypothetical protein
LLHQSFKANAALRQVQVIHNALQYYTQSKQKVIATQFDLEFKSKANQAIAKMNLILLTREPICTAQEENNGETSSPIAGAKRSFQT